MSGPGGEAFRPTNPYERAKELGQRVVLPGPCDLFLDIDSEEHFDRMVTSLEKFEKSGVALSFAIVSDTPSKSGGERRHVVIRTNMAMTHEQRILFQALDREINSWLDLAFGSETPTVFFEAYTPAPEAPPDAPIPPSMYGGY